MSARGLQVAVTWFTMGSKNKAEVRLAISTDAGVSFGAPLTVDDAEPRGRPDVTHLADGSLLVVWLGQGEVGGELRARRYLADGTAGKPGLVVLTYVVNDRELHNPLRERKEA